MIKMRIEQGKSEDVQIEEIQLQSITLSVPTPNQSCNIIANIIINKLISSIDTDGELNELEKSILIKSAQGSKIYVEKYLTSISNKEAQEIIDQVKYYLE